MNVGLTTYASNAAHPTLPPNVPLVNYTKETPLRPDLQLQRHKPVTPVKVDRLNFFLTGYHPPLRQFLVNGFSYGFRVGFVGERRAAQSPNLKSALEQPQAVRRTFRKELEAGRIRGPFPRPPFRKFVCSPLGIVPKKVPSEFRLIQRLSYPCGSSVNDYIPERTSSVRYASISDAITVIKQLGAGCFMAKTDIKSAFRIISIHPSDFPLLGMKWDKQFYYDVCLPMGLSSSCAIFEAFSSSLESISVHHFGASGVLHILDDFLFIAKTETKCRTDLSNFLRLCGYLGVPIAQEKTVGPSQVIQFAGITLDSVRQKAHLPEDKLQKCRLLLQSFYKRRKVTLRELQSLLGLLNFTCSVIVPGRPFLRRMIDLTVGVRRAHHRIRLSKGTKHDITVRLNFLNAFNGRSFFYHDIWNTSSFLELYTDAAGSKGYGAILGQRWFFGCFPDKWQSFNITFLELFPIVLAVRLWSCHMSNRYIVFVTDNAALVSIINQQTSKHKLVMTLIRDLVSTSLRFNIIFRARHIPGLNNTRADCLSRLQIARFKELSPQADDLPTVVPENLLPRSW